MAATRSALILFFAIVVTGGLGMLALGRSSDGNEAESHRWRQHDIHRPRPPVVEPASGPVTIPTPAPNDAVVLFDGTSLNAWKTPEGGPAGWSVKDGVLEVVPGTGTIQTKSHFGDVQLHVEWASPDPPVGVGQDRGNSGIFLMGQFEVQVLDSYKADTYADGVAGAIYGQYPPLANATRPPGQWQTYDIAFRRPRFDQAGKLVEAARITVFLNGILVQNNEEPWGPTSWLEPFPYDPKVERGPIELQDHSHPVRFRNIWIRNLAERTAATASDVRNPEIVSLTPRELDAFAGKYAAETGKSAEPFSISREAGHLLLKLPLRPTPLQLQPISQTVFILPRTDGRFTFQKDDQGQVTGALFRVGDGERKLTRLKD